MMTTKATQERTTLRSGIMMATRNPANERVPRSPGHCTRMAERNAVSPVGKGNSGSGKDRASDPRTVNRGGPDSLTTSSRMENERIQPVGESTRSCTFTKEAQMKKPFTYKTLSDRKCKRCGRYLKANLIAKNPDADLCWKCSKGSRRQG